MSPLPSIKLNDGTSVPVLGYGTGTALFKQDCAEQVETAYKVGYKHIDAAEMYANEESVGAALKKVDYKQEGLYLTTKLGSAGIPGEGLAKSLKKLDLPCVDLYLIHSSEIGKVLGLGKSWQEMEKLQKEGLTKSIGVSNYRVKDLEELMEVAKVTPAANQIEFHPYVLKAAKPLLEYCHAHGITLECYGPLCPITKAPGGPVDEPVSTIAKELGATNGQVLLKWAQQVSKGIILTTSSKADRMAEQLKAFTDFRSLTDEEVKSISDAGETKHERFFMKHMDE